MAVPMPDTVQNDDYGWGSFAHDLLGGAIGIEKARIDASKSGNSNTTTTVEHYDRNSQNNPDGFSDGSDFGQTSPLVLVGGGILIAIALIVVMKEI